MFMFIILIIIIIMIIRISNNGDVYMNVIIIVTMDEDMRVGLVGGTVTIQRASHQFDYSQLSYVVRRPVL